MPLADGLYTVGVAPEANGAGLYATGHKDSNEKVSVAVQDPRDIDRQIWKFVASRDEELPLNKYFISMWTSKDVHEEERNLAPGPLTGNPDGPVVTTSTRTPKWVVEEYTHIPGTYRISVPDPKPIDVNTIQHFVTTSGTGREVIVLSYPFTSQVLKPFWKLQKID